MRRALTHELAFFFLFSHSLDQPAGFLIEPSTIPWQRVGVRFWVSAAAYQQTEASKPGQAPRETRRKTLEMVARWCSAAGSAVAESISQYQVALTLTDEQGAAILVIKVAIKLQGADH